MKNQDSFDIDQLEVNGQSILNISKGLKYFEPMAFRLFAEQGITEPTPEQWYPLSANLNMLNAVENRYGKSTLQLIGMQVIHGSAFPPNITNWIDALSLLNDAYHMNHRGKGNLGFYRFEQTSEYAGKVICETPYPKEFNIGLILGTCTKFCPAGYQAIVKDNSANASIETFSQTIGIHFEIQVPQPSEFSSYAETTLTQQSLGETFQQLMTENDKLQAAEKKFFDSNLKLQGLYEVSPIGIALTDMNGKYLEFNDAFQKICGYEKDELNKLDYWQLTPEKYKEDEAKQLESLQTTGYYGPYEKEYIQKDGSLIDIRLNGMLITDSNNTQFIWSLVEDISESKNHQKQLETLAHFDPLTKLPNRTLLAEKLEAAIVQADKSQKMMAVCFLDLDDFKPLNDAFGHTIGDNFLVTLSKKLSALLRKEDTIARLGGDEFIILLNDIEDFESLNESATKILEQVASCSYKKAKSVSGSLGITLYPNDHSDPDTLIRHADNAMYQAKIRGKNRFHIFDMELDAEQVHRHKLVSDIEEAIAKDHLELYYQPKVNTQNGDIFGFEALIRWNRNPDTVVFPDEFLPYIANNDVEVDLDIWVLENAVKQLTQWRDLGLSYQISINVCASSLSETRFVDKLHAFFNPNAQLNPSQLQIEILESSALNDLQTVNDTLDKISQIGIEIALDDFGTGYSSLSYLRGLNTQTIKIDRSFVTDMLSDDNDYAIVKGIIGLAKAFDIEVIAEGVETEAIAKELCQLGCHLIQGYWIAKPLKIKETQGLIRDWNTSGIQKCLSKKIG